LTIRATLPEGNFAEARALTQIEPFAEEVRQKLALSGIEASVEQSVSTPRGPRKSKVAEAA
jgi:hypothetical protein